MRAPIEVTSEFREELSDELELAIDELGLDHIDMAEIVWLPTPSGGYQPVLWPMTLHRHGQDCNRA